MFASIFLFLFEFVFFIFSVKKTMSDLNQIHFFKYKSKIKVYRSKIKV